MHRFSVVYVHIHYDCGHEALRPVRQAESAARERYSDQRCQHCEDQLERRYAVVREVQEEREESLPVFPTGEWPPKPREVQQEREEEATV